MGRDDAGQADLDHGGADDYAGAGGRLRLAYPTNLALMRDGTCAYVGVGNTDQIVGINTASLLRPITPANPYAGGELDRRIYRHHPHHGGRTPQRRNA